MTLFHLHVLLLATLLPALVTAGPWCFKCNDAFHPAACKEVVICGDHEYCYTEKHSNNNGDEQYSSGCKAIADCQTPVKRSSTPHCAECCTTSLCNEDICGAPSVHNNARLWCAICDKQLSPSACDQVELCSPDEVCSLTKQTVFGQTTYAGKCQKNNACANKTLAADNEQCCNSNLCNTNIAFSSPDNYTSPPPPTTTPSPAAASASINGSSPLDFVSHNQANEMIQITCIVGGYPTPNVTWYFYPDAASGNGTSANQSSTTGSATTTSSTGTTPPAATSTTPAAATTTGNPTTPPSPTATTTASTPITPPTTSTTTTTPTTSATTPVSRQEITKGVTTTGDSSVLTITSPDNSTAGTYVCHVENAAGPADDNVTVTFRVAPSIDGDEGASNETRSANARDDVILDCNVDAGDPTPNVTWEYPQDAGGVEELSNGSLLLHNVHGDNSGDYVCVAKNSAGLANKTFILDVDDNSTATCPTPAALTTATTLSAVSSPTTTTTATTPVTTPTTPITTTIPTTTTTTPTTTTTTPTITTTIMQTTPPSSTPCVCPTCPPLTTLPATAAATTLNTTTSTTASTTASTTTTTTTPTTTTTASTTTPTTPTTTSTTTTTPSTTTLTTTTTTTTPTTTTAKPTVSAVSPLWRNSEDGTTILHCAYPDSHHPIIWSRLERDYNHSDTVTYNEDGHGILVVSPTTPHSMDSVGVYQCKVLGGSADDKAEFVVYKEMPGTIACRQEFDIGAGAPAGAVMRTTCGQCTKAPVQTSELIWRDQICNSAVGRGIIPESGGTVTWLMKNNNKVALLKEENGHIVLVT